MLKIVAFICRGRYSKNQKYLCKEYRTIITSKKVIRVYFTLIALQLSQYFLMKTDKDPQTDLQIKTYPTILTGKNIDKQGI